MSVGGWQPNLPVLTRQSRKTQKRGCTVLIRTAWEKLGLCLVDVQDLCEEVQQCRDDKFWSSAKLVPGEPYWPDVKPDPNTITAVELGRLCSTAMVHVEKYSHLLGKAIIKAEESENPREDLDDWYDRQGALDDLSSFAGSTDSIEDMICTLDQLGIDLA